jgi:disulfide bond formation protein DsbB
VDVRTVSLFLALLAVQAQVAVLVLLVVGVGSRRSAALARFRGELGALTDPVPVALLVASVAMAGSLYFSEVAHFTPCRLCWAQRAAVYPLVPLFALGLVVRRWRPPIRVAALVLNAIGLPISTYHVLLERHPQWETSVCAVSNPCTIIWVEKLGYVTIPVMALSAQALVASLLLVVPHRPTTSPEP